MGWVVSSNRLACMIIQAKVITIHLVEQKGINETHVMSQRIVYGKSN